MTPKFGPIRVLVELDQSVGFDRNAFAGIAQLAQAYDRLVVDLCWPRFGVAEAVRMERPDGIICACAARQLKEFVSFQLPCVNIANFIEAHNAIPVVGNDDKAIRGMAAEFFLSRGFKSFAYIDGAKNNSYFRPRRDAFCRAVEAAGFECNIIPAFNQESGDATGGIHYIAGYLRQFRGPLAVMCPFDGNARQVVLAAKLADLHVPEQVSVLGVDNDVNLCISVSPAISSVATASYQIGQRALKLLLSMIQGELPPIRPVLVPPISIVQRASTGEAAVHDELIAKTLNYMRLHLSERLRIGTIADLLATSSRTLERKFVESQGRTPLQELRRLRIDHAKRLLIQTDFEMKEVARRSGLIHTSRLTKLIKEATGSTPAQFRARCAKNASQDL